MGVLHKDQKLEAVLTIASTAATAYISFGPARIKNIRAEMLFTGTSNGVPVKVQGVMATGSTDRRTVLIRKSSQKGQVASTGTAADMVRFLRLVTTGAAACLSATKYCRVHIAALPSS